MSPDDYIPTPSDANALLQSNPGIADLLPFEGLSERQTQFILNQATVRRVALNDTVFHEGDSADNFYVLLEGALRIAKTTDTGENVVILHIAPGEMFGIAMAYDHESYRTTANAASAGLALSWPKESWDAFIRDYPGFSAATRHAVGERLDDLRDKIVGMATLKVEQRIARAIQRLIQRHGKETTEGVDRKSVV